MKNKRLMSKTKFLKKEDNLFNTLELRLNESYPNCSHINHILMQNDSLIEKQWAHVEKQIKAFKECNKNKQNIKSDILFNLGYYTFSAFLIYTIFLFFLPLELDWVVLLGFFLGANVYTIFKEYPYLITVIQAKFQKEDLNSLEKYRENLKDLKLTQIQAKINTKNQTIAEEKTILKPSLIEARNAALWQIQAFLINKDYLKKALPETEFQNLGKQIYNLYNLLTNLSKAQGKEKIKWALLIDESLDEIYNLYDMCEKEDTRKKLVKRL